MPPRKPKKTVSQLRKDIQKKTVHRGSAQPLKVKIAKALDLLRELPELDVREQTVLRRIQDINAGVKTGNLTQADYVNIQKIAKKYKVTL